MKINDIIEQRYSVRSYTSQKISKEILTTILNAAHLAPSACNKQPWHFYVIMQEELLNKIRSAYSREWFASAPIVIVACGKHDESWHRPSDNKDHCDIDLAIAIDHLILQATEMGLGSCWVCNFDVSLVTKLLQLDDQTEPIALIPIGYPADIAIGNKNRKDLNNIVTFL